jgi:tRNA-specific 2-thiouridylase
MEQCTVTDLHWLTSVSLPLTCEVQIRYRQAPQLAELLPSTSGQVHIVFKNPQRAITPGQSAVFYAGAQVLGGGIITV